MVPAHHSSAVTEIASKSEKPKYSYLVRLRLFARCAWDRANCPRIARAAGRRAAMERGMSSAEGVGTVSGGSAAEDETDEMQFSGKRPARPGERDD